MIRRPLTLALLLAALAPASALADNANRPHTVPLAEPTLFISPCGQPFRNKAGEPYGIVAWFKAVDKNNDGKIDREEFRAEAEDWFHKMDLRKNGVIDDEIISLYEKKLVPEILNANILSPQAAIADGGSTYGGPSGYKTARQGAAVFALINNGEPFRAADRSLRGRITLKDMLAQADLNFDELDYTHKGYLTLEELPHPPAEVVADSARKK